MRGLNYKTRFIDLAGELNSEMPLFWVRKLMETLNEHGKAIKGAKVLVLGVAYKKDIDDLRESPALDILALLASVRRQCVVSRPVRAEVLRGWSRLRVGAAHGGRR